MVELGDSRIIKQLQAGIEKELGRVGLLSRVFSRAKSKQSLLQKIGREKGKYSSDGKKIQDIFGVRIALYFPDDLDIAQKALKNIYEYDESSSTIDLPEDDSFSATRCNLIFKLNDELASQSESLRENDLMDATFEVQFRTVLSEGWHEVEHDLRYKCKDDWGNHSDLNRTLNGIYATLETSDWGMMKLFDEMCFRHYKSCEWQAMARNKFRLRAGNLLSPSICEIFDEDKTTAKKFFRLNRGLFLSWVLESGLDIPINLDNAIYASNYKFIKCEKICGITPEPILNRLRSTDQTREKVSRESMRQAKRA
jgi:ppGpp synthetase/RelA/SpoT-type nucleotidyltranferase